jgi:hypothetical protein
MYGDNLVYIRYRCDEERGKRYTTAEIIVHEADWMPPHSKKQTPRVDIRMRWSEKELQAAIGAAGGGWNREKKLWNLPYTRKPCGWDWRAGLLKSSGRGKPGRLVYMGRYAGVYRGSYFVSIGRYLFIDVYILYWLLLDRVGGNLSL